MRARTIQKSQYTGVALLRDRKLQEYWVCRGNIHGFIFFSKHETERDAAITYDKVLIRHGLKPVNIYKQ